MKRAVASSSWSSNPWVWVLDFHVLEASFTTSERERPIIFSKPMILALLARRKTQTRRVVKHEKASSEWLYPQAMWGRSPKPDPVDFGTPGLFRWVGEDYPDDSSDDMPCPYGAPGDRLWVREGVRRNLLPGSRPVAHYIADGEAAPIDRWDWQNKAIPAIHMPRSCCRLVLELTGVRCERLRAISRRDAIAEGLTKEPNRERWMFEKDGLSFTDPRDAYRAGWETLHG